MPERSLVLNDGTTINNGEAGVVGTTLALFFTGYTFLQVAQMMCDTEKTKRIWFRNGETSELYEGYTNCITVSMPDGLISVMLERAVI